MVIEDQNLLNSQYTTILNEKYPPRKFLRHNLTSWVSFILIEIKRTNVTRINIRI